MASHRRTLVPFCGLLACVLSWVAAPTAGAVADEQGRPAARLAPPPKPAPRVVAETATVNKGSAAEAGEIPGCRRLASSPARVKLNLKPETDIVDLVAWISSITCRQFVVPGTILGTPRKITVYAPQLITPDGAYRLFLSALDSVGLTVQESGRFLRIIETSKVKTTAVPLYGFAGERLSTDADQKAPRITVAPSSD